jgi:hypothetical protein
MNMANLLRSATVPSPFKLSKTNKATMADSKLGSEAQGFNHFSPVASDAGPDTDTSDGQQTNSDFTQSGFQETKPDFTQSGFQETKPEMTQGGFQETKPEVSQGGFQETDSGITQGGFQDTA